MSERPRPKLVERLEARRAEHKSRHPAVRVAVAIAGAVVLLGGVVMLVTPGPAFVLIPVGLAMLSLEFAWAERALEAALERAQAAQERAARTSTGQRVAGAAAGVVVVGAAVLAAAHWGVGPF
jgi:uncharacterized protein (TIGR02611 family)